MITVSSPLFTFCFLIIITLSLEQDIYGPPESAIEKKHQQEQIQQQIQQQKQQEQKQQEILQQQQQQQQSNLNHQSNQMFTSMLSNLLVGVSQSSVSDFLVEIENTIQSFISPSSSTSASGSSSTKQKPSLSMPTINVPNVDPPVLPDSLSSFLHDIFATLSKVFFSRTGDASQDISYQKKLQTYYRRMLLIWKDIIKSDIGNGNPLVSTVVAEWMRDLMPLQSWATISYVTVNDMSRLMQDLLEWAQNEETCKASVSKTCSIDPIRMQFAVEFMRASIPLVLTGNIKLGVIKKFLTSMKRVSRIYPRVGFQMLGLLKSNPPLMIHSIIHMFSTDDIDLNAIKGTSVSWGESPDMTFYQLRNCVGETYAASLDKTISLCDHTFGNGQGVNLSGKSIKLSPNSFVKLVGCPANPANKQPVSCSGNGQEDCESHCEQDRGQTQNCINVCNTVKVQKRSGILLDNCANPVTIKCLRTFYSEQCFNLDNQFYFISYAWGKTMMQAGELSPGTDSDCPQV